MFSFPWETENSNALEKPVWRCQNCVVGAGKTFACGAVVILLICFWEQQHMAEKKCYWGFLCRDAYSWVKEREALEIVLVNLLCRLILRFNGTDFLWSQKAKQMVATQKNVSWKPILLKAVKSFYILNPQSFAQFQLSIFIQSKQENNTGEFPKTTSFGKCSKSSTTERGRNGMLGNPLEL